MGIGLVHFLGGSISYHGLLAENLIVAMALISGERSVGIGLFALGVFVGSLVWQFGLVFAATITSKFTNHKVQQEIQYSGALLILVLAIVLILW
jgi:arginine exporter protein ArgO